MVSTFIQSEGGNGLKGLVGDRYFSQRRALLYIRVHENLLQHPSNNIWIATNLSTYSIPFELIPCGSFGLVNKVKQLLTFVSVFLIIVNWMTLFICQGISSLPSPTFINFLVLTHQQLRSQICHHMIVVRLLLLPFI